MKIEDLNKEPTPQDFLMKTGNVWDIEEASSEDVKIADETEKVIKKDPKYADFKDLLINAVPGYLKAPVILDYFTDRIDRRNFKVSMAEINHKAFDLYDKNKLAHHNIRNFFVMFDELLTKENKIDPNLIKEISEIKEKVTPPTPKYDSLSDKERLEVVNSLTDLARRVCKEIIK